MCVWVRFNVFVQNSLQTERKALKNGIAHFCLYKIRFFLIWIGTYNSWWVDFFSFFYNKILRLRPNDLKCVKSKMGIFFMMSVFDLYTFKLALFAFSKLSNVKTLISCRIESDSIKNLCPSQNRRLKIENSLISVRSVHFKFDWRYLVVDHLHRVGSHRNLLCLWHYSHLALSVVLKCDLLILPSRNHQTICK